MAGNGLIGEIIAKSGIPTGRRRREVEKELRAHVEDFAAKARAAGHAESDIERMLTENFGDPVEIGRNFEWVYRHERGLLRLGVFAFSTVALSAMVAGAILLVQGGIAAGFGTAFSGRHTIKEVLDILATVAVYVAMTSIESVFPRCRRWVLVCAVLAAGGATMALHVPFLTFGCAAAVFLRMVRSTPARWVAAPLAFAMVGILFWTRSGGAYSLSASLANWIVAGVGYQLMTTLAVRVDRGVWSRLQ
jgi:hypothetical protein